MRKGENIFQRKDGRWEARYIKGYELSGKAKYGFCYGKTYKDAKEKVAKYKAALVSGNPIPTSGPRHRFAFYCDEWLQLRKSRVRESTYIKYDTVLKKHIKPKLGGCFPLGITTGIVDDFSKELLFDDKLAVKTVRDILTLLHDILKYTASQFPGLFPTVEINYPKEDRRETRVLSHDEQNRFTEFLSSDTDCCKFGVLLMLMTGIRIGELCALKWENIDLIERTIRISGSMQRLHDAEEEGENRTRIIVGSPKSSSSARTIPITDHTVALCRRFEVKNADAYVLTGTEKYMEPRVLQYRIEKYTYECGIKGVHAHTLRHTFATRAVEVGFEIKSLSEILGHAATTVTLERYVHSSIELKRANMDKLAAAGL